MYRLGEFGTGTISHDLNRYYAKLRGKEDPYAKVIKVNDRTKKGEKGDSVWALRNINLDVKQGDMLGIIGLNGAGKSTLLKILSRITAPTSGTIKIRGRLAGLLEVGTGFHPEMTGRENIYMNGTIMGMRKWEINKKLDEIVEFAGVAKYLDTPAKRYSSGMTVRLGFAVAAFLEPDILVVDEVLAVGDIQFQKVAIQKMQSVNQISGRTVLFVSHNMDSIKRICKSCIVLNKGEVGFIGNTNDALEYYESNSKTKETMSSVLIDDGSLIINEKFVEIVSDIRRLIKITINFSIIRNVNNIDFSIHFFNSNNLLLFMATTVLHRQSIEKGNHQIIFEIDGSFLKQGEYYTKFRAIENKANFEFFRVDNLLNFQILPPSGQEFVFIPTGIIQPTYNFELKKMN